MVKRSYVCMCMCVCVCMWLVRVLHVERVNIKISERVSSRESRIKSILQNTYSHNPNMCVCVSMDFSPIYQLHVCLCMCMRKKRPSLVYYSVYSKPCAASDKDYRIYVIFCCCSFVLFCSCCCSFCSFHFSFHSIV